MKQGPPRKPESYLDKPITRREFIKSAGSIAGGYAAGRGLEEGVKDYNRYQEEESSQYAVSELVNRAIELMDSLNLDIPKDQLYGFTYPTTKEMAAKYREALDKKVGDPPVPSVIVVQEKDPKTLIGSFMHRNRGTTAPRVQKSDSANEPSFLRLPSYMETYSSNRSVSTLYHEGLHAFYQNEVVNRDTPEEIFLEENMPNIGNILIAELLRSADSKPEDFNTEGAEAYREAVAKGDKTIWETYLKKLYK